MTNYTTEFTGRVESLKMDSNKPTINTTVTLFFNKNMTKITKLTKHNHGSLWDLQTLNQEVYNIRRFKEAMNIFLPVIY